VPAAPTNHHMTSPFTIPRMGRRTAILATALASVVAFASVVDATTSPVLSVQAAESRLNQAIAVRRTAEQRVTQLQHRQDELRAQIARASTETEAVTTQLAAAREVARVRAVDAYVNGGIADQLTAFLRSDEIDDASARTAIMSSQAHSAVEAADAFQKLKEENDPKVVALAERLHGVSASSPTPRATCSRPRPSRPTPSSGSPRHARPSSGPRSHDSPLLSRPRRPGRRPAPGAGR